MKTAKTKCPDLIYCIDCKHFDNEKYKWLQLCNVIIDTIYKYDHMNCYKENTYLKPRKANKDNDCKYFEPKLETPKEKKSKFNIFRRWFK